MDLKEQLDVLPPANERVPYAVITTTDPTGSPQPGFIARLFAAGLRMRVDVLDWNRFFLHLLDPTDISLVREGVLCMIFIRFEDWDHFQEYARTRTGEPSYAMVRKKICDLIYAVDCASVRSAGRVLICVLPCSDLVGEVDDLVSFFEEMTGHMTSSLAHHDTVQVIDLRRHSLPLPDHLLARPATPARRASV